MKPNMDIAIVCSMLLLTAVQPASSLSLPSAQSRSPSRLARISSRDDQNTTAIPAPVSISPSQYWDGNDGPWSSFEVQVGHPAQNVRLFPGTAATTTWTISPNGCPNTTQFPANCADLRGSTYNSNYSNIYVPNSIYDVDTEVNLGMDVVGQVGFDTITLGWQGTGGPTAEHSIVFSLNNITYWLGILGINPRPTNFTNFVSPQASLLQILVNTNQIPSLSYGYTAGNQYRFNKVYGSLTLGGYDQNRFHPTNITFPFGQDISRDLSVNLRSITTDGGSSGKNLLPGGSVNIFIDSTIPELWLPASACAAFEQAFGLVWNDTYQYYVVNDTLHTTLVAQNPNVTFTLGREDSTGPTLDIVLPYGAFDLQLTFPKVIANSSYYFPLKRAADASQYTLGRTFLQEAYLIADYDRQHFTVAPCNWNQSLVRATALAPILRGTMADDGGHVFSSGDIAGVAVGVIAAVVLIAVALFFLIRRHRNRKALAAEAEVAAQKRGPDESKTYLDSTEIIEVPGHSVSELPTPRKNGDPDAHGYSEVEGSSYFGTNGTRISEMNGSPRIFEMPGSDVNELPAPHRPRDEK